MRYKGTPIDEISLFNTPHLYLELALLLAKDCLHHTQHLLFTKSIPIAAGLLSWLLVAHVSWFQVNPESVFSRSTTSSGSQCTGCCWASPPLSVWALASTPSSCIWAHISPK